MAAKASAKDAELLERWLGGESYREIGAAVDMSHEGVRKRVLKALDRLQAEGDERIEKAQTIALARLDRLLAKVWPKAAAGEIGAIREARHIVATHAKVAGVMAADHGDEELAAIFAERERLAELHGEAVVQVLVLVLGDPTIGVPPEKQEIARRLAGQHLRELSTGTEGG